jgi:predicted homoserine dehydrogenase-like protein
MTVTANALGFTPATRGMYGPATSLDALLAEFELLGLFEGGPYVDYQLGGRGVFVVVRSEDRMVRSDFRYLKLGDGPYYLFHEPRVLIHYQAPESIARAVRLGQATVAPAGTPVADTIAYAKRDLMAGQCLDGIGGFDTYGLIARADEAVQDRLLPIGMAQFARLTRPVAKDAPIAYDDVEFHVENLAVDLRHEQDAWFQQRNLASGSRTNLWDTTLA